MPGSTASADVVAAAKRRIDMARNLLPILNSMVVSDLFLWENNMETD